MILIGLTGGIASGKSTVAGMLRSKGAHIIDADRLGHEAIAPGQPAYDALVARFSADILASDGTIDRSKLAAIVFADPSARADLESVTHPVIYSRILSKIEELRNTDDVVVLDAALLVEMFPDRGRSIGIECLVVVSSFPEEQLKRMIELRGMDEVDARARIDAQAPAERKLAAADIVVNNRGTLAELEESVDTLWSEIHSLSARS